MKKITTHLLATAIISLPFMASAAIGLQNPLTGVDSISDLMLIVARVVRYISIPFIIIMIMWAGFQYIWASRVAGSSGGIKDANTQLRWTIIGAFVLLSAELIALVLRNTINSATQ